MLGSVCEAAGLSSFTSQLSDASGALSIWLRHRSYLPMTPLQKLSCGRYIDDTYEELLRGDIEVEDLPVIKVKRADPSTHQYWADRGWDCALFWAVTGNCRTWVYRRLQVAGVCDSVRCELSKKGVGSERFTTTNCGDSVVVRYKGGHASQLQGTSACTCLLEFASCLRGFCSNCCPAYSSKYCSIHRGMMCKARCGSQGQCKHGFCGNCCPAYSAKYCRMHYGPSCRECGGDQAVCGRGFCFFCCPAHSAQYCPQHHLAGFDTRSSKERLRQVKVEFAICTSIPGRPIISSSLCYAQRCTACLKPCSGLLDPPAENCVCVA